MRIWYGLITTAVQEGIPKVRCCVFNTAKTMTAIAASQTEAEAILKIYADTLPKIVVGYDKDLEKCFNKDFQHFLDIRYNAVSQGAPVSQNEPVSPENGSEN